jgi:hypothetical protein
VVRDEGLKKVIEVRGEVFLRSTNMGSDETSGKGFFSSLKLFSSDTTQQTQPNVKESNFPLVV